MDQLWSYPQHITAGPLIVRFCTITLVNINSVNYISNTYLLLTQFFLGPIFHTIRGSVLFISFYNIKSIAMHCKQRMFWYETSKMFHATIPFILYLLHYNSKNHIYFLVLQASQLLHFHQGSFSSHSYKNNAIKSFKLDFVCKNTYYL